MSVQDLLTAIHKCMDDLDFVSARKFMEDNVELLKKQKHRLDKNAQDLLEFVMNKDELLLTQNEIHSIYVINTYAANFDVRSFKRVVKEQAALISREAAWTYLNDDAKALLESMPQHA